MGTLILSIRIIIILVFLGSLAVSFMMWRAGYPYAPIILLVGLGVFLFGGGILVMLKKLFPQTAKHFVEKGE